MSITTNETRYADQPKSPKRRRIVKVAIVIIAVLALAAAIVLWGGQGDGGAKPAPKTPVVPKNSLAVGQASADLTLSTRLVGGEPRGFPHSEAGAIEAATAADSGMAQVLNHRPTDNQAFLTDTFVKHPDLSAVIARKKQELGLDSSGQMIHPMEGDRYYNDSLYQFGAYRIESSSPDAVSTSVWKPILYGSGRPESVDQLKVQWSMTTYDMKWVSGDWRVSNDYGRDETKPPVPTNIDRVDVSFKERRDLLGTKWNLYQGATEKWPVDLLGPEPQGTPQ